MNTLHDFRLCVVAAINEFKRVWKRRAWIRQHRASIDQLPF